MNKKDNQVSFWKAKKYNIILYFKIGFPLLIVLLVFTSADLIEAYIISFIFNSIILIIFPISFYHSKKGKYYLTKPIFKSTLIVIMFLLLIFSVLVEKYK